MFINEKAIIINIVNQYWFVAFSNLFNFIENLKPTAREQIYTKMKTNIPPNLKTISILRIKTNIQQAIDTSLRQYNLDILEERRFSKHIFSRVLSGIYENIMWLMNHGWVK